MRMKPAEPRRSFSIYLPNSLYLKLENRAGRGRINTFINQVLEKELDDSEEQLKQQLIKGYQTRAKNKNLQKALRTYGETSWKDISTELVRKEKKNDKK